MIQASPALALRLSRLDGQVVAELPIAPVTLEPAVEWTVFQAMRARIPVETIGLATVEALVAERVESLHAWGFRVSLPCSDGRISTADFDLGYLARAARMAALGLLERGVLQRGEEFRYGLVIAGQEAARPAGEPRPAFEVEEDPRPYPVVGTCLDPLRVRSVVLGAGLPSPFPVFLPEHLLLESYAAAEGAGARETGGILLGWVLQEPATGEIAVQVTALIPARHVVAGLDQITFTPETWADVEAAQRSRGGGEVMVGWMHSHPSRFFCGGRNCAPEVRLRCPLQRDFFSVQDLELHETVFSRAFQLALVITHADSGSRPALYGWQQGDLIRRGFHLLDPTGRVSVPPTADPDSSPDPELGIPYETCSP